MRIPIPYKLKRAKYFLGKMLFAYQCRSVLHAPLLVRKPGPTAVVTMLSTKDMLLYLLAIRLFCRWCPIGDIVILNDGTLTAEDQATLKRHLGDPIIVPVSDIPTGACPRGGCWERLLHILDLSADRYVIQMDSDVLTLAPIPEVLDAIEANAAFTLSSSNVERIVDLETTARNVAGADPRMVQVHAEQVLPRIPKDLGTLYIRGSAGFAGFPAGGAGRARAEAFSVAMQRSMGDAWTRWGTEQVTSNFIVANAPQARVLPWSRYQCFYGTEPPDDIALLHFIGTWRYDHGVYRKLARRMLAELAA
jgi:hypothetical protein